MSTQTVLPALPAPTRPARDNLLGICAALGEDFGFNPLWLRIALAATVLVNMEVAVAVYVALGTVVALSRVVAPARRHAPALA